MHIASASHSSRLLAATVPLIRPWDWTITFPGDLRRRTPSVRHIRRRPRFAHVSRVTETASVAAVTLRGSGTYPRKGTEFKRFHLALLDRIANIGTAARTKNTPWRGFLFVRCLLKLHTQAPPFCGHKPNKIEAHGYSFHSRILRDLRKAVKPCCGNPTRLAAARLRQGLTLPHG